MHSPPTHHPHPFNPPPTPPPIYLDGGFPGGESSVPFWKKTEGWVFGLMLGGNGLRWSRDLEAAAGIKSEKYEDPA